MRALRRRAIGSASTALLASVVACNGSLPGTAAPEGTASSLPLALPATIDETIVPKRLVRNPNPLELPSTGATFQERQFVYAVPDAMLASARVGSSLELRLARVEAMDGTDVVVRMGTGPAYTIHPAYLVAPIPGRASKGDRVIAPYRDTLRHAIVQRESKALVVVRYGDADASIGEQGLPPAEVGLLRGGLEPGSYALHRRDEGLGLVLLVSAGADGDGTVRWLALGAEGEALRIEASRLQPVPDMRHVKPDGAVLIPWHGAMVPATVRTVDPSGLVTVRRPRVGPPLTFGYDMVMPAPRAEP